MDICLVIIIMLGWTVFYWNYKKTQYQKWHKHFYGKKDNSISFINMIRGIFR